MSKSSYIDVFGLSLAERLAAATGFSLKSIQSPRRDGELTAARHEVVWRLAKDTDLTLPEIAAIVKRDHTTVIHAIRAENERRDKNVRGLCFPEGYKERKRIQARLSVELSREVVA